MSAKLRGEGTAGEEVGKGVRKVVESRSGQEGGRSRGRGYMQNQTGIENNGNIHRKWGGLTGEERKGNTG